MSSKLSKNRTKESDREYYKNNKDKFRKYRLKCYYGITVDEYNQLLEDQNNGCAICGELCKTRAYLSVDHCHRTNRVRGLLCDSCNVGLGRFKDSPELLEKASKYLRKDIK